jgi:hypothetical protein
MPGLFDSHAARATIQESNGILDSPLRLVPSRELRLADLARRLWSDRRELQRRNARLRRLVRHVCTAAADQADPCRDRSP